MWHVEVCVYSAFNGFQETFIWRHFLSSLVYGGRNCIRPASEGKLCFEVIFLPNGEIRGNPTATATHMHVHTRTHTHKDLVTVI